MRAIHPEQKSFSSISSIYGKNSGVEIKTCAALDEMVSIRIPAQCNQWWCILVSFTKKKKRQSKKSPYAKLQN